MGIYLDVWICRYESEFSKALSQWILLTIKGFVLIYWVVIIKTGINKYCTTNNKGMAFFPFFVVVFSHLAHFIVSMVWLQTKHCCLYVYVIFNFFFSPCTLHSRCCQTRPIQFVKWTSFHGEWLKTSTWQSAHIFSLQMERWQRTNYALWALKTNGQLDEPSKGTKKENRQILVIYVIVWCRIGKNMCRTYLNRHTFAWRICKGVLKMSESKRILSQLFLFSLSISFEFIVRLS